MFNENLKALRKQKGYSQEQLAVELNVVRQTVSKWEKGISVPDITMLDRIAKVFDISVIELIELNNKEITKEEQLEKIKREITIKNEQKSTNTKIKIFAFIVGFILASMIGIMIGTYEWIYVYICGLLGSCVALLLVTNGHR